MSGAINLDTSLIARAEQGTKKAVFTPVKAGSIANKKELEDGRVIGVLEAENLDGIPDGKHNIFVSSFGNTWHAFAESDGRIVARAKHVRVEDSTGPAKRAEMEFNFFMRIAFGPWSFEIGW